MVTNGEGPARIQSDPWVDAIACGGRAPLVGREGVLKIDSDRPARPLDLGLIGGCDGVD